MKRLFIILFAFIVSFGLAEFIINNILGYPKRTGQRKFAYASHIINSEVLKWKSPYTKYWTVEGGNNVFSYNNIGLPGADVSIDDSSKIIFMLGDSFLEAMQVNPKKMAVSVFADLLKNTNFRPLNLGSPNNDPYLLWFRSNFYEKYYKPDYVCLLVTCLEVLDLNFQNYTGAFNFTLPDNFGIRINDSKLEVFANVFRNNLASVNLIANGLNNYNSKQESIQSVTYSVSDTVNYANDVSRLKECLIKYKSKYGEKFFVVSMEPDDGNNKLLVSACDSLKIPYARKNLLVKENILEGGSHLNELGNQKLGELFYDTFIKLYKK